MSVTREDRRKVWLEKINEWEASKKTAFSWCKEKNINPKTFYNWRSFFYKKQKKHSEIAIDSFIEVPNKIKNFELEIECKQYIFKLKSFDLAMMKNLMILLKDL